MEQVILVDEQDHPVGVADKLAAHQDGGCLHRAFSVFVFNDNGELLLQKRAADKYHFGGLWSNTCCGHPRPGEPTRLAARRRLREEFGFDVELQAVGSFVYHARDPRSDLVEHEFDHVFTGRFDGVPKPAPNEIESWKWVSIENLRANISKQPDQFTPWLSHAMATLDASAP